MPLPNVPETMSAVNTLYCTLVCILYIGRVNTIHVTSPSLYCECTAGRRAAAIFAQKFDALCCLTHVAHRCGKRTAQSCAHRQCCECRASSVAIDERERERERERESDPSYLLFIILIINRRRSTSN